MDKQGVFLANIVVLWWVHSLNLSLVTAGNLTVVRAFAIQLEWGQEIEREDQIGKTLLVVGIPGRVFWNIIIVNSLKLFSISGVFKIEIKKDSFVQLGLNLSWGFGAKVNTKLTL